MLSIAIGYLTVILWSLALLFVLIAIVFHKTKVIKWIFGILAFVFGTIPVLLLSMYDRMEWQGQKDFVGHFYNAQTGGWINLNDDLTWTSNSRLFDCTEGIWKFIATEDYTLLEMRSSCDDKSDFLQISAKDSNRLVFNPNQTSAFAGNELSFIRE